MARLQIQAVVVGLAMLAAACAKRQYPAPIPPAAGPVSAPAPGPSIFALLPDVEGKPTAIVVTNSGGAQEIREPNHAVRVEREDAAPTAPFPIDQPTMRRIFGAALDAIPDSEIHFLLYFDEARDTLNRIVQHKMIMKME